MSAKHEPGPSRAQARVLQAVAAGAYTPMVLDGRTLRAIVAKGWATEHEGYPPLYAITDAGRAAVAKAAGSAS